MFNFSVFDSTLFVVFLMFIVAPRVDLARSALTKHQQLVASHGYPKLSLARGWRRGENVVGVTNISGRNLSGAEIACPAESTLEETGQTTICRLNSRPMTPKNNARTASNHSRPALHRLTYSSIKPTKNAKDELQYPKLPWDRDGMAFLELLHASPLQASYSFQTSLHLYPGNRISLVEFPPFNARDLFVMTTRPPLDDAKWQDVMPSGTSEMKLRKNIFSSECELEAIIFAEVRKYFATCLRSGVRLTETAARLISRDDAREWKEIAFDQFVHHGKHDLHGAVKEHVLAPGLRKVASMPPYTIGFLIRANNLPKIDCDLIVSFGMDADATLIWNRIVRMRFPNLLEKPGFTMAKLIFKQGLPKRAITPMFADHEQIVGVEFLTNGALS